MGTTKKRAAPDRYDTRWTETQVHLWGTERPVSSIYLGRLGPLGHAGAANVRKSGAEEEAFSESQPQQLIQDSLLDLE